MVNSRRIRIFLLFNVVMILVGFNFIGCTALQTKSDDSVSGDMKQMDEGPLPSYYDFGDVLIPSELKLDTKSSSVYQTADFTTGFLVLHGRVERSSLIQFFENNMAKDNWKIISAFKSNRTIMLFHKQDRWCVINITDSDFKTKVEIWVAPTMSGAGSGLMK